MKILKSLFVVLAMAAITAGATGAYFTASDSVTDNTFSTGSLSITAIDEYGGWGFAGDQEILAANMKPGDEICRLFGVRNDGTVPAKISFRLEMTAGDTELWNVMQVQLKKVEEHTILYEGPLNAMGEIESPVIQDGGIKQRFNVCLTLPEAVGNEMQNKTATFDFVANATTEGT